MTLRWVAALLVVSGCAAAPVKAKFTPERLEPSQLEGVWYVMVSNFPRWERDDLSDPIFRYTRREDGRLDDQVAAKQIEGGLETIEGVDTQHETVPTHFTWRGKRLLALFTSEWDVVALDSEGRWAVVYFSSTIATPEGVDIISRAPALSEGDVSAILELIRSDAFLASKAKGLFHVSHGGTKASFPLE